MKDTQDIPTIAIDGGTGTGKSSVRTLVATHLGFHELDSGVLYRAVGLFSIQKNTTEPKKLVDFAKNLNLTMKGKEVFLDGRNETQLIRSQEIGKIGSVVAKIPEVRMALRHFQLNMRKLPGLVADGRDQGEIFENSYRFFLETPPEVRAQRRVEEFKNTNEPLDYETVLTEILRRDESDINRSISPLKPHPRAWIIDTRIPVEQVADIIIKLYLKLREHRSETKK